MFKYVSSYETMEPFLIHFHHFLYCVFLVRFSRLPDLFQLSPEGERPQPISRLASKPLVTNLTLFVGDCDFFPIFVYLQNYKKFVCSISKVLSSLPTADLSH